MKRFLYLVVLMAFSSSAHAGNSFSFVVAGHRVIVEAPRDCSSPSCVSVSIPGIYEMRGGRDGEDDSDDTSYASDTSDAAAPVKRPAVAQQQVPTPIIRPASKSAVEPVASPPPPAVAQVAPTAAPAVAASPPSKIQPANTQPPKPLQPKPVPVTSSLPAKSADTPQAVPPAAASHSLQVLHETDDDPAEAPLGDWQTEGNKGSVRIERCGQALCGYVLNPSSNASGETVLINMKPKTDSEWSGNIYSRDSGSTYYATIAMQGPDSLRVEACALGRFFCSGNVWSRIGARPEKLVTSHRALWVPRS
jgi:uncharacterized protein (DUF2147 family)